MQNFDKFIDENLLKLRPALALDSIWEKLKILDTRINSEKLWEDTNKKLKVLVDLIGEIRQIVYDLQPFLPETAEKIERQFKGPKIKSEKALFPRLR